jgi:predicted cupin superfamily sugar epimerase
MNQRAEYYIEKLGLLPHPEGGFFKETYRSSGSIKSDCLPAGYKSGRNFSTLIYYMLAGSNISAFHKLKSDEIWHFYDGSPVKIIRINENRELKETLLGKDLTKGETFQAVIPKNSWFGAELADKNSFGLIGCTVSPGFEYEDLAIGKRDELIKQFPEYRTVIEKLTNV